MLLNKISMNKYHFPFQSFSSVTKGSFTLFEDPIRQSFKPVPFSINTYLNEIEYHCHTANSSPYDKWLDSLRKNKPFKMVFDSRKNPNELKRNCFENRVALLQYAANNPVEDRFCVSQIKTLPGYLATVLDGHGGFEIGKKNNNNFFFHQHYHP